MKRFSHFQRRIFSRPSNMIITKLITIKTLHVNTPQSPLLISLHTTVNNFNNIIMQRDD